MSNSTPLNTTALSLEGFKLNHLKIQVIGRDQSDGTTTFGYSIGLDAEDQLMRNITFTLDFKPDVEASTRRVPEIDISISGRFKIHPKAKPDNLEYNIRFSAASVLYGIVRGIVGALSGVFGSDGQLILPLLDMNQIITALYEKERQATTEAKSLVESPEEKENTKSAAKTPHKKEKRLEGFQHRKQSTKQKNRSR